MATAGALTYAQLKAVWLQASSGTKYDTNGWATLMAAIAEAESNGDPNATNPTDNGGKQTSWGLWQISLGNHAPPSPNWNDPVTNAKLAIGKLNGQGLGAWGTYTSGAYKAYLSSKTAADTAGLPPGASAVTTAQITAAAGAASNCAWSISYGAPGGGWLSAVGGVLGIAASAGAASGQICIVSYGQVRAIIGGWMLLLGGGLVLGGIGMVAGLEAAPFVVPGVGKLAGRLSTAQAAATRRSVAAAA